jgi:hypothetical protein
LYPFDGGAKCVEWRMRISDFRDFRFQWAS